MKIKAWLITFVLLASLLAALYFYKNLSVSSSAAANTNNYEPAAAVVSVVVKEQFYKETTKVTGTIKPVQEVNVRNEFAGQIVKLSAHSGKIVEAGELLVVLDTSQEQAEMLAAQAKVKLAEQTLNRYQKLFTKKEISAELVDKAQADLAMANSALLSLKNIIAKKQIKAPFKALVGLHHLSLGQFIDKNTILFELIAVSNKGWVEFALPQTFNELPLNTEVTINTISGNGADVEASVIAVDSSLTEQSRQLSYRAEFLTKYLPAKPNTLVTVNVPLTKSTGKIIVPDLALTHDQFGDFVFVLEPNDSGSYRAKRTQVWFSSKTDNQYILDKGLIDGQLIATDGAFKLRDGMKVYLSPESPTQE